MIKIVFILPYAQLRQEVEEAFSQLGRDDVEHTILTVEYAEEELKGKVEGDVVIARGFSSQYLSHVRPDDMLNVEISTTGFDLVMAVNECIRTYKVDHIAILGTKSMVYSSQNFGDLFEGVVIDRYYVDNRDELTQGLDRAIANGAQAVVGGRTVHRLAQARGLSATMIRTGREAIMKALEMSIRLVEATRKERAERDRISKIMNYSNGGILSTDARGMVQNINRKACTIFRTTERKALGRPVSELLPRLEVKRLLASNEHLLDEICRVNGRVITVNFVPILNGEQNAGAVITCHEAQELQKTEAKIRQNILQKGFVARYTFDDIIHEDPATAQTIETAKRFSYHEANVLLNGETGAGKEMFAQSVHNASTRSNGPFVALNCAALPEQLLESELFGYVEGAFTGAVKGGKMGMFEAAHRGTLFLDEIGDMSLKLQGRLLRAIQEKEIVRLGDDHVIPVDVRIIAATNKNLNREVELGNFRSDLMYRLDVLKITIPPLRNRKKDILPLAWHFIREVCQQENRPVLRAIEPEAERLLRDYPWYGNVRQLHNAIQRICVLCDGDIVDSRVVREALELNRVPGLEPEECPAERSEGPVPEDDEAERIRRALRQCGYRKGAAAELLGIDRSTLWRKMKKLHIT